jgi:hypothetical protein
VVVGYAQDEKAMHQLLLDTEVVVVEEGSPIVVGGGDGIEDWVLLFEMHTVHN